MLVAPGAGVGGVDRVQLDCGCCALGGEPVAEHRGGDAGHRFAEPFAALAAAHGLAPGGAGMGEVEVLDRDGADAMAARVVHQRGDGVPDLRGWADYLANEAALAANRTNTGARPPREGSALCQGIIACGSCGKPMRTNYHTDQRPSYECSGRADRLTTPNCRSARPEHS